MTRRIRDGNSWLDFYARLRVCHFGGEQTDEVGTEQLPFEDDDDRTRCENCGSWVELEPRSDLVLGQLTYRCPACWARKVTP